MLESPRCPLNQKRPPNTTKAFQKKFEDNTEHIESDDNDVTCLQIMNLAQVINNLIDC